MHAAHAERSPVTRNPEQMSCSDLGVTLLTPGWVLGVFNVEALKLKCFHPLGVGIY